LFEPVHARMFVRMSGTQIRREKVKDQVIWTHLPVVPTH
jgi:hypothetical protein